MLFGTYQQMFKHKAPEPLLNTERYYNEKLGFAPAWAIPMTDYKTAIASSMCSAPNCPDIFYVIDTDAYIRVNKVKYYEAIMNGQMTGVKENKIDTHDYSPFIDDSCDDMHSEFILDTSKITNDDVKLIIPVLGVEKKEILANTLSRLLRFVGVTDPVAFVKFKEAALKGLDRITLADVKATTGQIINEGVSREQAARKATGINGKIVFETLLLPLICEIYINKKDRVSTDTFFSILPSQHPMMRLQNEFADWSFHDCSIEKYDNIVNEMKNHIIDEPRVLSCLASGKKIGPNDKCPCESGLKFKKCHGRYL